MSLDTEETAFKAGWTAAAEHYREPECGPGSEAPNTPERAWRKWKGIKPATWRDEPASDKQKSLLHSWGTTFDPQLNKGEASDLITEVKARRAAYVDKSRFSLSDVDERDDDYEWYFDEPF